MSSDGTRDATGGGAGDGTTDATGGEAEAARRRALFRVVRGTPSGEEVAALTLVLAAVAAVAPAPPAGRAPDRWSDPQTRLRAPLRPGPGAWWASALPR